MNEQNYVANDEISLIDIYEFLKEGWKTIAATTVLGGVLGVSTAFVLPEKFLASAFIQTGRVSGKDIESPSILIEKMRSPTYYSPQTLRACEIEDSINPNQALNKALNPTLSNDAVFISISYKSKNIQTSVACLNAVLDDINRNQSLLATSLIEKLKFDLKQAKQRLEKGQIKIQQEEVLNRKKLQLSREKLRSAEKFISEFEANNTLFKFNDEKFSASSLLLATILNKQAEAKDLKIQIDDLEMKIKASLNEQGDKVLDLEKLIEELEKSLITPMTDKAKFSTPVFAPTTKIEPKRSLITVISLLAGGFIGLMLLVLRRWYRQVNLRTPLAPSN